MSLDLCETAHDTIFVRSPRRKAVSAVRRERDSKQGWAPVHTNSRLSPRCVENAQRRHVRTAFAFGFESCTPYATANTHASAPEVELLVTVMVYCRM